MTSQQPASLITGTSLPRTDGVGKVTGAARYTADVPLTDALWGRLLRSPYPYARIKSIDASRARALPGVHAVITGADVQGHMTGRRIFDIPLIASDVVRFVGDIVAAIAAVDKNTADRAATLIDVEYEVLDPVLNALEAAKPGATLLHPDFNDYAGAKPLDEPSNVFVSTTWGIGDLDAGFAAADVVIEGTYTTAMMHQAYMETHNCLVEIADDGRVNIWASNKAPHMVKRDVAQSTGVDPDAIHVHHITIGGDFGGKGGQMNIPIAYFLAQASGQPVRMVMDYQEELTAANPRHPTQITIKTGANRDGSIVACKIDALYESGAYAGFLPLGFLPGPRHAVGPYHIPNASVTARHVYTNRVPAGHMRGPGEPQTIFAMESHIDVVARHLGLDPADVRRKNVIRDGEINGLGEEYHDLHGAEALETALTAAEWDKPRQPTGSVRRGRGVGIGERAPGGGETHAAVTYRPDGSVVIHTSIFEQGSGTYTILTQMVADVLHVVPERISVEVWDTDETGFDSGAGASRNTRMASEAVTNAAQEAKASLFTLAAEVLGWPEGSIELSAAGLTHATDPAVLVEDLLARTDVTVTGSYDYKDMAHSHVTAFTIQIAEVAVDVDTGQLTVERLTSVHDAGKVLNPIGHLGQVNGGAIQGFGYSVMEEIIISDGRVETQSFADFKIPSIADVPEFQGIVIESPDGGVGPLNIKGIGENPSSPMAPAIANAVADAIGVRITDLPITAEKIYRALQARRG